MKFTDGNWLIRPGIKMLHPFEVRERLIEPNALTIFAPSRHVENRAVGIGDPLLEIRYSSPLPDVMHVQIVHHKGQVDHGPHFQLQAIDEQPVEVSDAEHVSTLRSGKLAVHVQKAHPWNVEFTYDGRRLTGSGDRSTAHITTDDGTTYMREQLDLAVGEYVYGLGERFTAFAKNGQVVDSVNADGGTGTEQAYKSIPFYLTNNGYGVFVNHPETVSFEIATERVARAQFSVPGESLDYYIVGGASLKEVLGNYTALTGKPSLPPAWSFGLWLSTSFTTNYDEQTVTHFVDGMAERDLPVHVFHFDCFWMKGLHWSNFQWDEDVFPDPEGMLRRLKQRGLKICVWINPYIAQRSHLFEEGRKNGYLIKKADGSIWQTDLWQPGMGIVDFTNSEARTWYTSKLKTLLNMGVDCFKTDFGERIPLDGVYADGSDAHKMHNYYAYLYNETVYNLLKEVKGEDEAVLFARSASVGSQKFPVHWGGDSNATYESMAESLRGGLSFGLSGFGFWSHDIGGFENTAPADIYKRWLAFGMLSSHSRLHGSNSYRVPWNYDQESVDVLRFFTRLKCSLMPYLYDVAHQAKEYGLPVMRAMLLEFDGDPACDYLDRQYMLGSSLLVAPIFNQAGEVKFYLPAGSWMNFLTGEQVQGGSWRKEQHGYLSLPLYARDNSMIAIGNQESKPDYDYAADVVLHVFLSQDGQASTTVRNTHGEPELQATVTREGKCINVHATGVGKAWSLVLRGISEIVSVEGGDYTGTPQGVCITPLNGNQTLHIVLA
ncbi:alpha-xylosidase [Dictyobacter arantiisoli]|uniref:alpha-D-xyloside xylohydrolase n=1 Tax=Dictyobacter arantiisoli TaxID=2014874 RepID=A0A5A5TBZ8_9CHLR|nr:alpha-xylosidase [Dictyobacter arantiisoli]GCF08908.1 alpha-xylosidase [Dictyobacter arantiisoli]